MHAKTFTLSHNSLENLLVCLGPRKQNPLFHWVWIWLWVIYTQLLSGEAVNSCLARRAQQSKRLRAREKSLPALRSPAVGLKGGWGGMLGDTLVEEGVCALVCVCNWSAVAGICSEGEEWGRGWQGSGCPTSTQTHPLTLTHSQGSVTLQIKTSPSALPLALWTFKILESPNGAAKFLWSETFPSRLTFKRSCRTAS